MDATTKTEIARCCREAREYRQEAAALERRITRLAYGDDDPENDEAVRVWSEQMWNCLRRADDSERWAMRLQND